MNLLSFIHPVRTFLPCSGVGRHMIGVLKELSGFPEVSLSLLHASQWLESGGNLPVSCPLRDLPGRTFPGRENWQERGWKLLGWPGMDRHVPDEIDWVYCPMETRLLVKKCPVAITLHDVQPFESGLPWSDSPRHRRHRRMWGMWLPKALRECRVVFTVSEFSRQRVVELLGGDPGKIVVSGNGVDEAYFRQGNAPPPAAAASYVLLVGGLRVEKGGRETLAVARQVKRLIPELEFRVAGEPSDPTLAKEAHSEGNFRFLGKVPDEAMPGLMAGAVCLLFLSLYEGFGMPPLEAMACGTPVIAARRAAIPEVTGDAAWLVEPAATDEIAEGIISLANDSGERGRWREKGMVRAREFNWRRVAERVYRTLEERG